MLENVHVAMETESTDYEHETFTTIDRLIYNEMKTCYVVFRRPADDFPSATFTNALKFVVKDCDPETFEPDEEGYDDEYIVREPCFSVL